MMTTLSRCKALLGCYVEISLEGDCVSDYLLDLTALAFSAIERVHCAMSFQAPDSELSELNRQAYSQRCAISTDMHAVLKQALQLSKLSKGLFDVTVAGRMVAVGALPDRGIGSDLQATWQDIDINAQGLRFRRPLLMDLSGIAKGYAVDCAIEAIAKLAPEVRVVVNAGGDLRMSHWRDESVAIRSPVDNSMGYQLTMTAPAVASSGCYFLDDQDSVIFSPGQRQASPAQGSYSVFADSCMLADGLTKIVFLQAQHSAAIIQDCGASAWMINDDVITPLSL